MLALASEARTCWHEELVHSRKKKHVVNIEGVKFKKDHLCGACEAGKMTRVKHPLKTIMTTSRPFELLHMDLFGPTHYSTRTTTACLYGFVIVDDYSRYTWVYLLAKKSETFSYFTKFAKLVQNEKGVPIVSLRSDHGREFENYEFENFCDENGVKQEFSTPRTPQQNGLVKERIEHCKS